MGGCFDISPEVYNRRGNILLCLSLSYENFYASKWRHQDESSFLPVKILTKMVKRVQSDPQNAPKSLFHKGLMKMLVLYALREVQVTSRQLLISLGLDDQDAKQEKPKASKGKGSTSKISAKLKEVSPVDR
jgi:hypothetical protein